MLADSYPVRVWAARIEYLFGLDGDDALQQARLLELRSKRNYKPGGGGSLDSYVWRALSCEMRRWGRAQKCIAHITKYALDKGAVPPPCVPLDEEGQWTQIGGAGRAEEELQRWTLVQQVRREIGGGAAATVLLGGKKPAQAARAHRITEREVREQCKAARDRVRQSTLLRQLWEGK